MITQDHYNELDSILAKAVENEHIFTDWENGFITEWVDRLDVEKDPHRIRVSDKQSEIIERIKRKLEKAGEL